MTKYLKIMKNKFLIILFFVATFCNAQQIYSLRPAESSLPEGSYQKDINNELPEYEGTWKGTWDNKTVFVTFKKLTNQYDTDLKYYKDYLIGKFKVIDGNGSVLFDNSTATDASAKITGHSFRRYNDRYLLSYIDYDLCNTNANIAIKFADSSKTQLIWKLTYGSNMITIECPYYNTQTPEALPKDIILTKQ